jgi:hypothetical protein
VLSRTSGAQRLGRPIDADDRASGTHQIGNKKRHIARATADVEDVHPGRQAGIAQESLGEWAKDRGLVIQSALLRFGVAEYVLTPRRVFGTRALGRCPPPGSP